MMKSKGLILTAALALLAGGAQAQDKVLQSYSFVEAQGGVQLTSTNAPMDKLITPTAAISFGHYFTPVVGARLHVNAWEAKSGFKDLDQYYKWKYVTPDLDLMLNLSNLFCGKQTHALNLILLGGVGLNYAWDNDELRDMNLHASRVPLAWGIKDGESKGRLSHNLRAGLRLETNPAKKLGLSLEVNANSLSDRFNSKTNDADDWQFTAMLGLSFRFGHKYKGPRFITKTIEVIDTILVDEPEVIKVKEKKPVEKMEQTKMEKAIFFNIRESDADKASGIDAAIKEAADLMKTSEDAKITVTGYADKGTGTAAINKKYAKQRAESVAKKLTGDHGIDAARITVDSKGDTVQPYPADNDKNRCVIVAGEGTFKVKSFEEVEVEKTVTKKVQKTQTRQVEVKEEVKD
jgi:outer membrane protein OmpA-like peptidoglycan-associated protein